MPSSYAVMDNDEMTYVNGGSITIGTVCAIITAAIGIGTASYSGGKAVGQRLYYAGVTTNKIWSKYKWTARSLAIRLSAIYGTIFMLGLENKLYSMITGK